MSDSERMETTAAHFAQIVEVESRSVSGMMGTYISEFVARGGIEPPTRGFSASGSLAAIARKPKTSHCLLPGIGLNWVWATELVLRAPRSFTRPADPD